MPDFEKVSLHFSILSLESKWELIGVKGSYRFAQGVNGRMKKKMKN